MAIDIFSSGTLLYSFPRVLTASLVDRLDGERTLEFSVLSSRSLKVVPGMTAKLDGQVYSIVRVSRKITGGFPIATVSCEHISYLLNDEQYDLVTFVFEGSPADGLRQLLADTPFTVGIVEAASRVEVAFTEGTLNRRNALMRFIDACGCEVEYDGYAINLRKHRGSVERKKLMDGENVSGLSVTLDSRENTAAYEISLFKMADLQAGDEVHITYTPMGIDADTRIIGITYDPFYRYTIRVEVGDYVPNLMASNATQTEKLRQEFRAADGVLRSTIQQMDGSMSELKQTVSSFDTRIKDAEGNVPSLSQTVGSFETRIQNAEGTVSSMEQTVDGFDTRIANAEGEVSSMQQTVSSFSTRITNAEGDVSTLKQTAGSFETRISSAEGNVSSLKQAVSDFTTQIKDIEGNLTTVTQTANKISWLVKSGTSSTNFELTDRAITLVANKIDLSGFVTFTALSTSGKTTINGANITTGKISADRIDTDSLKVRNIYSSSGKVSLKEYTSGTMYIGGDGTWNYDYLYLFAGSQIRLGTWSGVGAHSLIIDTENHSVRPATIVDWDLGSISYPFGDVWCESITVRNAQSNDGFIGYNGGTFEVVANGSAVNRLGSSTYYWDTGYISKLYLSSNCYLSASASNLCVNGTAISSSGGDLAGKEVKMGGNSTYYIVCNTSRELRPGSTSTTYPAYLDSSSYYWHYAYIGSVSAKIGSSASSKLGFFTATPVAKQTLSTSRTDMSYTSATASNYLTILNNLVGILKNKYGLIA